MIRPLRLLPAAALLAALPLAITATSSSALTAKECSAKYKAAKADGKLVGMKWNDFRKAHCSDEATAATKPATKKTAKTIVAAKSSSSHAVFPKAVDPKYAKESPGRARMHTCRDQYRANKAKNANGGLKWIMKGGGYYSLCNKALKS